MRDHYDFSQAKRGAIVKTNKERITIRLDPGIIQWFRDQVKGGGNYQSLMNDALREHIQHRAMLVPLSRRPGQFKRWARE